MKELTGEQRKACVKWLQENWMEPITPEQSECYCMDRFFTVYGDESIEYYNCYAGKWLHSTEDSIDFHSREAAEAWLKKVESRGISIEDAIEAERDRINNRKLHEIPPVGYVLCGCVGSKDSWVFFHYKDGWVSCKTDKRVGELITYARPIWEMVEEEKLSKNDVAFKELGVTGNTFKYIMSEIGKIAEVRGTMKTRIDGEIRRLNANTKRNKAQVKLLRKLGGYYE